MEESKSTKEHRFQLSVKGDNVILISENGFRYDFPHDPEGCQEITQFLLGSIHLKPSSALGGLGQNH